jgi:HD superfamily phosphohydrolase
MKVWHLSKRAFTSLSHVAPSSLDTALVRQVLNAEELVLWSDMQNRDQRHSIVVLRRFDVLVPGAVRAERAAALLHDIGKNISQLGFFSRVIATVVGARGTRFSEYHNHETLGADLIRSISDPRTVELVGGIALDDVALLLQAADDI